MQNKTAYTKLIRRDETGETTATLDMTEEEFKKIISIYGKGEHTTQKLQPYTDRLHDAKKAALPGEELKENNFNGADKEVFEKAVVLMMGWAEMLEREMLKNRGFRIKVKYNPEALKTDFAIYTPTEHASDDKQTEC